MEQRGAHRGGVLCALRPWSRRSRAGARKLLLLGSAPRFPEVDERAGPRVTRGSPNPPCQLAWRGGRGPVCAMLFDEYNQTETLLMLPRQRLGFSTPFHR